MIFMLTTRLKASQHLRNRDGIALPVALLALVAVSILVTSLLLSSATEVSLSAAHQDATRRLFTAEGAIEAFIAERQTNLDTTTDRPYLPPEGSARDSVLITVSVLGNVPSSLPNYRTDRTWNDTTYAVTAAPRRGGRQVVAMIDKVMRERIITVNAGLTSGDNVAVSGGAKLSDGSDSPIDPGTGKVLCDDNAGARAVELTADSKATVTLSGGGEIIGATATTEVKTGDLVKNLFGISLDSLVKTADIKLNSRNFPSSKDPDDSKITLHTVGKVTSLDNLGAPRPNMQSTPLNWGCPADIFQDCRLSQYRDADTTRLPVIAINACKGTETPCTAANWGTTVVDMSHGQGVLIVYGGNFRVAGQFAFKGLILTEGSFRIDGRGGDGVTGPKIEGAVIGLGLNAAGQQSTVLDNEAKGNATVRYNRCALNLVTRQVQQTAPIRRMDGRTFGWFEVVR